MRRALPTPPRMQRAERMRLQRERDALRLKLGNAQRLHRVLREQSAALRECRVRIDECPELRALIHAARAATQPRFEFRGCNFMVRQGLVFAAICTAKGRHLVSMGGAIFRD